MRLNLIMFQLNTLRNLVMFPVITDDYNNCLTIGIFPEFFKTAEVIPTYKKDKPIEKTNYRPISILSNISNIYERKIVYYI